MIRPGLAPRSLGWTLAAALLACNGDDPGVSATDATTTETTTTTTTTTTESTGTASTDMTTSSASETSSTSTTTTTTTTDATTTTEATTTGVTSTGDTNEVCGDGVLEPEEECDGAELGGMTCASLGFDGGELGCQGSCLFDTAGCSSCGDGELDPGEGCDDGNTMAGDGCDPTCQVEACDPDGQYAIMGAPVAYSCCNGLVTVNVNSFLFTNDGASIASTPSNPVPMTGAATTCPEGDFANQGSIPGGCTETYAVSGSFVDKDTWKGTYELKFSGGDCSCFNGMLGTPCVNQTFPVTAKR